MRPSQSSRQPIERIALVTDFGAGIYVGQMQARLSAEVPGLPVIDLVHDLKPFRPDLAAHLFPALVRDMPAGTLFLCVVDPGVGGDRAGLVAEADGNWFVGPDNGLLAPSLRRAAHRRCWRIAWTPDGIPATFHGRDWFLPVAARLCRGGLCGLEPLPAAALIGWDRPSALASVVYVDAFGNLMIGLPAADCPSDGRIRAAGLEIPRARTFSDLPPGAPFWYENSLGLVEIAVNQGRADRMLDLAPGDPVEPDWPLGGATETGDV